MYKTTAKVTVKDNQGKVVATQEYTKIVFEGLSEDDKGKPTGGTDEELLGQAVAYFEAEAGKDQRGVIDLLKELTYGYDLGVKATVRQQLMRAVAGPDKAIEKAIKDYMAARAAMGKPVSEEIARKKIMED